MKRPRPRVRNGGSRDGSPRLCADDVVDTSMFVVRLLRTELVRRPDAELSVTHLPGLVYLRTTPGSSLSQVARYLGLGMPTASKLVAAWTRRGLVLIRVPAGDRRRRELYLTAEGAACVRRTLRVLRDVLARRLGGLSPRQRIVVRRAMTLLRPRVEPLEGESGPVRR